MRFLPDPAIYPDPADFARDMAALQDAGRTVLVSIGGAADPVVVDDPSDAALFTASMIGILEAWGFDGVDIDLEGSSLFLSPGDSDYRAPVSPRIVHFIAAIEALAEARGEGFVLTTAPETAFVQGGFAAYAGIWGAYLPVIHALRDRLALVHVQHYNTGSMFGRDGQVYEPATADFHVAMADMLLAGFTVSGGIPFEPLEPQQVAIGLPATPEAAGSGFTAVGAVHDALDYLVLGVPFGGAYELADPDGYASFRGLMTWSINWDVEDGRSFSIPHREYLDGLPGPAVVAFPDGALAPHESPTSTSSNASSRPSSLRLERCSPNPLRPGAILSLTVTGATAGAEATLCDAAGRAIRVLPVRAEAGRATLAIPWDGIGAAGEPLGSGLFFCVVRDRGGHRDARSVVALGGW